MSEAFQQICAEVDRATRFLRTVQECRPHYQRVLDYIMAHPEERDPIAGLLAGSLTGQPDAARASITAEYAATIRNIDCERVMRLVWKPMIKKATELPRKAATAQKLVTVSLVAGSMADLIV